MRCSVATATQHDAEYIIVAVKLAPTFVSNRAPMCRHHAIEYLRATGAGLINRNNYTSIQTLALTVRRIDNMTPRELAIVIDGS